MKPLLLLSCALALAPARAAITVYENGDKKLAVGGQVQVQYLQISPDGGDSSDRIFFRRLRPVIEGSVTKNWRGVIAFDFGQSLDENEVAVKDAYFAYSGWKNLELVIGNDKTPYSRIFLTSSKRLQFVERDFTGDHNFGTPDRMLGLRLNGHSGGKRFGYSVAVGGEQQDPNVNTMDFDTPANNADDWNEGGVVAGRVDFYPRGEIKFAQVDFHTDELRYYLGAGVYYWENDGDNNTYTNPANGASTSAERADLDNSMAAEISAGLRGHGWSADAVYSLTAAETVERTFTGGLYRDGSTTLDRFAVQGGYLFRKANLELVAGYEFLDADNYADTWRQTRIAVNYYWNEHKGKVQMVYRMNRNLFGAAGDDQDAIVLQTQFLF